MTESILLTIAGPDKPGLVHDIAELVSTVDGNWLRSRLAHLGGQFAGVIELQLPSSNYEKLDQALDSVRETGLAVSVYRAGADSDAAAAQATHFAHFSVVGNDRPGIVASISQALALHGVNVEELQSDVDDAPMASGPLFRAEVEVSYGEPAQLERARAEIESLAHDLMIDLSDS